MRVRTREERKYNYRNTGFADMRDRMAKKEKETVANKPEKRWKVY